jgi:hypothetical protein
MGSSAIAATMDYLGAWSGTTTYATGKVVVYNRAIYYSLRSTSSSPNRNRLPTDATWWAQVGTLGNTLHSGLQAPMNAIGNVGDYYIDTANNRLFGPKNAVTGWPAGAVNLVGQTGPAGAQGSEGATGPQGAQGPQGIQGLKGDTGVQGSAGNLALAGKSCKGGFVIGFDVNGDLICSGLSSTYQYVQISGITFADARSRALNLSSGSNHCYLANITTQAEMDYIQANVVNSATYANVYIGGRRDSDTSNTWYWTDGPEANTVFWETGTAVGSKFTGWDPAHRTETMSTILVTIINGWYRPYVTGGFGTALSTIGAGGNSGFLVECTVY